MEDKNTEEVIEPKGKPEVETKEEPTIEETLEIEKERTVPESALIKHKKEEKRLAKELKELKSSIEDGANQNEISSTLEEISSKHNVSKEFLKDLIGALKSNDDIDERIESRLRPLTEEAKATKIDNLFNLEYKRTLEAMPEFKDIVSKDVIKSLTLDPSNRKKTFKSIIEKAYGHLLTGKRTLEKTSVVKAITGKIDFDKASTDKKYMASIMADPKLKEEYNAKVLERIG